MPPQNNSGQVPSVPPSSGASFSVDSLKSNQKFIETVKVFAIYGTLVYVANTVVSMVIGTLGWSSYGYFNVGALISAVIMGAIGSAIGGAIFYFLYNPINGWIKRNAFVSKHINSIFTLFWKPFLVGTIISAIFGLLALLPLMGVGASMYALSAYAGMSFGGLFIGLIIGFVAHIIIYYFYSKAMAAKLTPLYQW